jgi:hypothetical protein
MSGASTAKESPLFEAISEVKRVTIVPHIKLGYATIQCLGNGFIRPDLESDDNPLVNPLCDLCGAQLSPGEFVLPIKK